MDERLVVNSSNLLDLKAHDAQISAQLKDAGADPSTTASNSGADGNFTLMATVAGAIIGGQFAPVVGAVVDTVLAVQGSKNNSREKESKFISVDPLANATPYKKNGSLFVGGVDQARKPTQTPIGPVGSKLGSVATGQSKTGNIHVNDRLRDGIALAGQVATSASSGTKLASATVYALQAELAFTRKVMNNPYENDTKRLVEGVIRGDNTAINHAIKNPNALQPS